MKYFLICLLFCVSFFSFTAKGQTTRMLKKNISLLMAGEEGSNGASLVWHPVQNKYYAAFAGKTSYPLVIFDVTGKKLSPDNLTTLIDVRGLWFNNDTKLINGNAYKDLGWFSYKLDAKGSLTEINNFLQGQIQPSPQSVGAYNSKNNLVYFLNKTEILAYDKEGKLLEDSAISLTFNIPEDFKDDENFFLEETYNLTTLIYTGINKSEFGLLNYSKSRIELYNKTNGTLSQILKLPEDAISYDWLNFAFTNGIYWLFEKDNRKWVGYK